jgi:CRP-like cAMP-binding protein
MTDTSAAPSIPDAIFDVLRTYLEARAPFAPEELETVRSAFLYRRLEAGAFLRQAGEIARQAAFVARGCLRNYVIDSKGKEHIIQFAPETWWLADATSLNHGTPCSYFVDAIETSELLLIDGRSHQRVVDTVPGFAAAFRMGLHAILRRRTNGLSRPSPRQPRSAIESSSASTPPSRLACRRPCSPHIWASPPKR